MKIKNRGYNLLSFIAFLLIAILCIHWIYKPAELKNGSWRAIIQRPDRQQIVFNFETKDSAGKKIIHVINGSEHLLVDSILFKEDSVFIQMPFFESGFNAKITSEGNLEGVWIKQYGKLKQTLPFEASWNIRERFKVPVSPGFNITGRWSAEFTSHNRVTSLVGEFKQTGSYLTGTFRDPTGDYRFLEGVVTGDSLKLSTFDGAHAFLFTAKIDNQNQISGGKFYSGARVTEEWSAKRNADAGLPDGFSEIKIKSGSGRPDFSFPDSRDSSLVSALDEKYKNKVVVIQILGSWCPNCMDETRFLSDYYNNIGRNKDVEIVGLAYERTTDFVSSQKALEPFKKRFHVQYPILITGVTVSDSLRTEKTLPQLEKIGAFPTTVFIGRKGYIQKVHSGFDGPATGDHYTQFKKEFDEIIDQLLKEK